MNERAPVDPFDVPDTFTDALTDIEYTSNVAEDAPNSDGRFAPSFAGG